MTIPQTLIAMKDADLALRTKLLEKGELSASGYHSEMETLHNQNAEKLQVIINEIGYPDAEKVGKEANEAAWLIVQHAISQPDLMRKCITLINNPLQKAYLTDRIAFFENQPQLYGTQFDWDENGVLTPCFYDNLEKVNERRKIIELNSLEEETLLIRERAKAENNIPPNNFPKRKKEFDEWRKKVGWLIGR